MLHSWVCFWVLPLATESCLNKFFSHQWSAHINELNCSMKQSTSPFPWFNLRQIRCSRSLRGIDWNPFFKCITAVQFLPLPNPVLLISKQVIFPTALFSKSLYANLHLRVYFPGKSTHAKLNILQLCSDTFRIYYHNYPTVPILYMSISSYGSNRWLNNFVLEGVLIPLLCKGTGNKCWPGSYWRAQEIFWEASASMRSSQVLQARKTAVFCQGGKTVSAFVQGNMEFKILSSVQKQPPSQFSKAYSFPTAILN